MTAARAPWAPTYAAGFFITLGGVLTLTPDGLLVRLIDLDLWAMVFWRGVLTALALMAGLAVACGRRLARDCAAIGRTGLAIACLLGVSNVLFVVSLAHTSVANTLVLLATTPVFAALFSWALLRERLPGPTIAAIAASVCGVALVAVGGLGRASGGDWTALGAAAAMGMAFTLMRRARGVSMIPATALGAVLAALVAVGVSGSLAAVVEPAAALPAARLAMLLLLGLAVQPIAFAALTIGPRAVPAPEVSLLLLLETVLGPLWVWLALGEGAPPATLAGGAIVVVAQAAHAVWRLRRAGAP